MRIYGDIGDDIAAAGRGEPSGDKAHDVRIGVEIGQVADFGHGEMAEHQSFGLQENSPG